MVIGLDANPLLPALNKLIIFLSIILFQKLTIISVLNDLMKLTTLVVFIFSISRKLYLFL